MITIKVFGPTPPCAKCKRAEREAKRAAERFPEQVRVEKLDALGPEAQAYGVMVTPTVVVDDEVLAAGKVILADQLASHIKKALGG
jgi:hypothetical protein